MAERLAFGGGLGFWNDICFGRLGVRLGGVRRLNIYKIEQDETRGWDTYSDAVVAAESEEDAKTIYPDKSGELRRIPLSGAWGEWTNDPTNVRVTLIGVAVRTITCSQVICSSFHAG